MSLVILARAHLVSSNNANQVRKLRLEDINEAHLHSCRSCDDDDDDDDDESGSYNVIRGRTGDKKAP